MLVKSVLYWLSIVFETDTIKCIYFPVLFFVFRVKCTTQVEPMENALRLYLKNFILLQAGVSYKNHTTVEKLSLSHKNDLQHRLKNVCKRTRHSKLPLVCEGRKILFHVADVPSRFYLLLKV